MQTVWLLSSIIEREEDWEEKAISTTKEADSGQEEWEEDAEGKEIIKEKKREKKFFFAPSYSYPP